MNLHTSLNHTFNSIIIFALLTNTTIQLMHILIIRTFYVSPNILEDWKKIMRYAFEIWPFNQSRAVEFKTGSSVQLHAVTGIMSRSWLNLTWWKVTNPFWNMPNSSNVCRQYNVTTSLQFAPSLSLSQRKTTKLVDLLSPTKVVLSIISGTSAGKCN